jgi:hypothetical protein
VSRVFGYIQRNPAAVSGPCFVIVMANLAAGARDWVGIAFVSIWFAASVAYHVRRRRRGGPWLA